MNKIEKLESQSTENLKVLKTEISFLSKYLEGTRQEKLQCNQNR